MGLFLSLSGVIGANPEQVIAGLIAYADSKKGKFCERAGTHDQDGILVMSAGVSGQTILYPNDFFEWDEASEYLSVQLNSPVFSFHMHDGDLWMFLLFVDGKVVTQFNPIPKYWDDEQDEEEWKGSPETVCQYVPGIRADSISKYFTFWDLESDFSTKAYPDDEFSSEDWQLCDFMRRLGLVFPLDNVGKPGTKTFEFVVPTV